MTPWQKLFFGLLSFLLGLGYLYRPVWIEKLYSILRETLLNDAHIALERRKWGVFFILISFLLIYMGLTALNRAPQ